VRVLGLDPGTRRIGVALSDATGTIAAPHSVIDRRTADVDEALRRLVEEHEVELIVVGLPVSLSGAEGPSAEAARVFADSVADATGLPIVLQDERFTTVIAEGALIEGGVGRGERRRKRDQVAAAVMLQSFLDRSTDDHRNPHP
jgi:putative Holliday junction resolvase